MPPTNIIVNGSFDLGNTGWTGTDLETSYRESAYLGNGSTNRVAEMDGNARQVTVMRQTVAIDGPLTTDLTLRSALRTASSGNAGLEGFRVDILDSSGAVIATQTFRPISTDWTTYSLPVTFPAAGTYTIRLTERGPDDSLGAIIDDVSMLVCFTAGTLVETGLGPRRIETLEPGDRVWTLDDGLQVVRWIGQRQVEVAELQADISLRPILFATGSLGPGVPERPLAVSPQHRIYRDDWRCELYFGHREVLVPAFALVNGTTIRRAEPVAAVTYVHLLLDGHQILKTHGLLSESFFPSALSLTGLDSATRAELLRLFPDMPSLLHAHPHTARPVLCGREARLVA